MNDIVQLQEFTRLSPKLDVVFQSLFGEVGSEKFTSKFLEAILKKKIDSIDLSKNPILRREYLNDKLGILDIIAKINNSEYCNIEMQVAGQDSIIERILYYWGRIYTKQLESRKEI
ncbi:MAG: Rpn family recombination-promoting nuclease/putative transposase [Clostridia bacterium]|nr:Rpn family recombination-promoting nuclease/putative transposase [Clostridia bacterium]